MMYIGGWQRCTHGSMMSAQLRDYRNYVPNRVDTGRLGVSGVALSAAHRSGYEQAGPAAADD